ncbi:MAG TPA: tRNA (guanine(10)-N(2))-dimethyltransferase [Candidatus Thermoplasmatota archaeon]|nr:tRNA (guanine(10)-N(2))-dimethyltransferase [Candidatus Thermoplasmatota archaeon]
MNDKPLDIVKEGTTELFVYKKKTSAKGPSARDQMPFYNPSMELNRDVSILVNQWLLNVSTKQVHILDGLAASGIRGIRLAHELEGDFEVTINDWNDQSFLLIQQNIQKSSLQNISMFQRDLNSLLSERRYNSIDIDPFGSPVYFLDAAVRSVYNKGVIACTATDTAALCGVFPQVCYRRYGAWPLHSPSMHEIGLRILLGFICREAAKYDRGIEPLLCYTTDHYIRIYVQIINGKNAANSSMAQFLSIPARDIPLSKGNTTVVGPLWMGKLQKKPILQEIRTIMSSKTLSTKNILWNLLYLLEEESDAPPFFYTTNDLSSLLKQSPPTMDHIFEHLRNKGFIATKTHCTPTGFKTNAPLDVITEVFK